MEVWTSLQEELEEEFGEDVPKELKDLLTKADVVARVEALRRVKAFRVASNRFQGVAVSYGVFFG